MLSWSNWLANWLTMSFMRGSLWLNRHVARSTNVPCNMVVWLYLFQLRKAPFPSDNRVRTQGGSAQFGNLLICLETFYQTASVNKSSIVCRPWIYPTLVSITAEIFLWTLLAVQKSECVLCTLMRDECRCNKYISTGLLTFCKARHPIEP